MVLKLSQDHIQAIRNCAESTYPEECCGLLLGQLKSDIKTVMEVVATENAWKAETPESFLGIEAKIDVGAGKRNNYTIAPEIMVKVQREARDRQLDIIGIYHSHPDHPAIPSEFDRVYAWQLYSYVIVSVQQGIASEMLSWRLDDHHQFQPEQIIPVESSQIKT